VWIGQGFLREGKKALTTGSESLPCGLAAIGAIPGAEKHVAAPSYMIDNAAPHTQGEPWPISCWSKMKLS
jgi:hypothetical protein